MYIFNRGKKLATILDGKNYSEIICNELYQKVQSLKKDKHTCPTLAVLLVGDNSSSKVYVNSILKKCDKIGFNSVNINLNEDTTESSLISHIKDMNEDPDIDGILIQMPLPNHIDANKVACAISPAKDVDCFNPINFGKLALGQQSFVPCTPLGALELLNRYNINIQGKNALVVGRSNIVGKPIASLLLQENATVTIAHSKSQNLPELCKQADILVAAIGKPEFIKGSWIKEGAIVVDVGINSVDAPDLPKGYKIVGDVEFNEAEKHASYITPVPGGCGSMTIAMLLKNTLESKLNNLDLK